MRLGVRQKLVLLSLLIVVVVSFTFTAVQLDLTRTWREEDLKGRRCVVTTGDEATVRNGVVISRLLTDAGGRSWESTLRAWSEAHRFLSGLTTPTRPHPRALRLTGEAQARTTCARFSPRWPNPRVQRPPRWAAADSFGDNNPVTFE